MLQNLVKALPVLGGVHPVGGGTQNLEQEHPILVDKYLMGREVEVDGVFDGEDLLIPGVMEHIERAGVHSGDSISVYPPIHFEEKHTLKAFSKA